MKSDKQIIFSSSISEQYEKILERMFYFNDQQNIFYSRIMELVQKYGEPRIVHRGSNIAMEVDPSICCQCLFAAIGPKLVGVLVYTKDSPQNLLILHIAVEEVYSYRGELRDLMLIGRMIEQLKEIAHAQKEIKTITIGYTGECINIVP